MEFEASRGFSVHIEAGGGSMIFDPVFGHSEAGREAFEEKNGRNDVSRATQIMSITEQLTRPDKTRFVDAGSSLPSEEVVSEYLLETADLRVPRLASLLVDGGMADRDAVRKLREKSGAKRNDRELWNAASEGDTEAAIELVHEGMDDEAELVRVSSAGSFVLLELSAGSTIDELPYGLVRVLLEGNRSNDPRARAVAQLMLEALEPPQQVPRARRSSPIHMPRADLGIGVHGTFSPYGKSPLAPNSEFYRYLARDHSPGLYGQAEGAFRWSGRYRASDRDRAAEELVEWNYRANDGQPLDVLYAHSHGGNVALSAIEQGLQVRFLVLLSTPALVRSRHSWATINGNTGGAVALRTHMDYAILADWIASRFPLPWLSGRASNGYFHSSNFVVHEPSPVSWFSHSDWLSEAVWQDLGIDGVVQNRNHWHS
ncbi:hypothetical protein [Cryobacterium sp. TMT2-42-4]|uniref:hypothetical protein n=1 Tax=Cryobacterium sp. TMT2-42-4 TaxID=1259255 RepID=UPI00106D99B6|nr:hypothetical protein [Cryobacterium sp. TMT2-42-4]TFC36235.1 hypothetical protein E3O18_08280 [Cryobacterium sp. TMT2-42-4]